MRRLGPDPAPGSRRRRGRRALSLAVMVGVLALTATACSSEDLPTFAMPERNATNQAPRILSLWQGSWIAAFAVGALVWGLIIWSVIFHRRKSDETELPPQVRYNLPIEVLYTAVPLVIIAVFFFFTARDESKIMKVDNPQHVVTVTGIQWSWQFTYTSDGGDQATVTGTPGNPPTLYLPEGESVEFQLRSDDVIHSFFVPAFLFKEDVIPGRNNHFQLTPTKVGVFKGKCAELCGRDHSRMLFNVEVVPADEFQSHVDAAKEGNQ